MTKFVETRETLDGTFSMLFKIPVHWLKCLLPVPGYNGGKLEFQSNITTTSKKQSVAIQELIPNATIKEDGTCSYTLKRPSFLGAPAIVDKDGNIVSQEYKKSIGNGSIANVKISHKKHPKTGRPYVCLEAIQILELVEYKPNENIEANFDF
jgi:hypothetical protein